MRILLVTQYFYPENFKSNDIAFELTKRGYQVDALVGIPNYPEGKYYEGYHIFRKRVERLNDVKVYRAFQWPRGKDSNIKLSLNYLTYTLCASVWAFFLSIFKKYDAVIVHQTSPITQGIPAVIIKRIQRIPMYFWVLDIWPDAMKSGGGIRNKRLLNFVDSIVKYMYKHADKILISSKGFRKMIAAKGDYDSKIEYFPNWSEDILSMDTDYPIPALPKGFKIMMAGNLGSAQNLEIILEAISLLKSETEIKWIFIGGGSKEQWLRAYVEQHQLQDTVYVLGRFPFEAMPAFYQQADALLISLKGTFPHLRQVVPARLQSYMSGARPILAMIDEGAAAIIEEAKCGYAVTPNDVAGFVQLIREKVLIDKAIFEQLGKNGRLYFLENFEKAVCTQHLSEILNNN